MRGHRASGFLLMIDDRTRTRRQDRLMTREMCVERLAVMMPRLHVVKMHVRQRRGNRAELHEHDQGGGGQPSKHTRIVVNRPKAGI